MTTPSHDPTLPPAPPAPADEMTREQQIRLVRACRKMLRRAFMVGRRVEGLQGSDMDAIEDVIDDLPVGFVMECDAEKGESC